MSLQTSIPRCAFTEVPLRVSGFWSTTNAIWPATECSA